MKKVSELTIGEMGCTFPSALCRYPDFDLYRYPEIVDKNYDRYVALDGNQVLDTEPHGAFCVMIRRTEEGFETDYQGSFRTERFGNSGFTHELPCKLNR